MACSNICCDAMAFNHNYRKDMIVMIPLNCKHALGQNCKLIQSSHEKDLDDELTNSANVSGARQNWSQFRLEWANESLDKCNLISIPRNASMDTYICIMTICTDSDEWVDSQCWLTIRTQLETWNGHSIKMLTKSSNSSQPSDEYI